VNIAAAREARDERDDVQRARGAVRARPVERLRKRSPVSGMLIRRTRLDREMTQAEFGALIGVSDATVSSWGGSGRPGCNCANSCACSATAASRSRKP